MADLRIICGPLLGLAFGPDRLAHGPVRSADDLDALRADAEALDRLFMAAPRSQWGAVALAAMSFRGETETKGETDG